MEMDRLTREMRAYLAEVRFAVVATRRAAGLPHQTVMWYRLESDDRMLLNTPFDSLKHRHLKRDPRLSVCVADGYRYVTVRGSVVINEDPDQAGDEYRALGQRYRDTFPAGAAGDRPSSTGRVSRCI